MNIYQPQRLLVLVFCTLLFALILEVKTLHAQPFVEGGDTKHRFAQMYFSAEGQWQPSGGYFNYLENGNVRSNSLSSRFSPRVHWGGMHFWGHADFYVAFELGGIRSQAGNTRYSYNSGVETGAKIYPWRLEKNSLRPYLGVAWSAGDYAQTNSDIGNSADIDLMRLAMLGGVAYQIDNFIIEAGARYIFDTKLRQWYTRTQSAEMDLPPTALTLGLKYIFDTTLPIEKYDQSGLAAKRKEDLTSKGAMSTFTLAIGPSGGFVVGAGSPYTLEKYPFASPFVNGAFFADMGIGYFFFDLELSANVILRNMNAGVSAFGLRQQQTRFSVALEVNKNLVNWNGFVPFVGVHFGRDVMRYAEQDGTNPAWEQFETKWLPGISFGWDIRPSDVDWWLLRTNLRYTPGATMSVRGSTVALTNFEFNFIQFVMFPARIFN
jgi:hypothetical protein